MSLLGIKLTTTGIPESVQRFRLARRLQILYIEDALERWGILVVEDIKTDHPYTDRTGNLTASVHWKIVNARTNAVSLHIGSEISYADSVEFGTTRTRPYPFIYPKIYQHLPVLSVYLSKALTEAFDDAVSTYPV